MRHYLIEFVVEGDELFPINMLHSERAFPKTEQDAVLITESITRYAKSWERPSTPYRIHLLVLSRNVRWMPTGDRWITFGWTPIDVMKPRETEL